VPLSIIKANKGVLDRYFTMMLGKFTENKAPNKPVQVINCNETGMPLGATKGLLPVSQ